MNVIEALFITLGLDTSDYEKKQKGVLTSLTKMGEASDKQTKLIAESGKKAAQTFSLLKVEVLGALAAFGMSTGFKSFIESNMNGQAALGRMSANLGMSTQKLQAWKLAAKEMGQSGEDATSALQSVAKGVAEARITGTSSLIQASRRFGFGVDTNNPEQTLINISRRMAQMHDRQQAMQIAEASGVGNISNLLLLGPDALEQRLAHTMALTGAATKASTEQAAKLQMQWADLQERFQQVGERVFNKLEPILARLGERLANWLDSINWQDVINKIGRFIDKVQEVVKAMGGWKTIAEVLGGVLALKLLSPLFDLVSVFGRLIPLIGTSTTGAWGAMAGLGSAAGVALIALTGIAALHIDSLGGKKRADGTYEDEAIRPNNMPSFTNADLWNRVKGRPSKYAGSAAQAATLLAGRMYVDKMDPEIYRQMASDILQNKIKPEDAGNAAPSLSNASLPRGARNNNPGNLNFAGQAGASLESGPGARFAQFGTMSEGVAALDLQLQRYMGRGIDSIRKIVNTYAPSSDDNDVQAYMAALAKQTHHGADDKLSSNDIPDLIRGIVKQEGNAGFVTEDDYVKGIRMAAQMGIGVPKGAYAQRQGPTTNTSTVSIGTLNVNTKATDANGVAKGMKTAMQANPLIAGSVTSLA